MEVKGRPAGAPSGPAAFAVTRGMFFELELELQRKYWLRFCSGRSGVQINGCSTCLGQFRSFATMQASGRHRHFAHS